jgi:hypothetical protein
LIVNLSIDPAAPTGFRDITVTTNLGGGSVETALGVGSLQIVSAPLVATILSISPSQITQGRAADMTITGVNSHFLNGSSTVSLGTGVTVSSITVSSPTLLTACVTAAGDAAVGYRNVTVSTGSEVATESVVGPLFIAAPPAVMPRILTTTPTSGLRGKRLSLTVMGENTHFGMATTVALSGTGVSVESVTVTSPTSLVTVVDIAPDASPGFRNIAVTTDTEVAVHFEGFNVLAGATQDLVVDFGPPFGLWIRASDTGAWMALSPMSAKSIVTGDLDGSGIDEVVVDFGSSKGIWVWANDSEWHQLETRSASRMVTGDLDGNGQAELIIDVAGQGILVFANNLT